MGRPTDNDWNLFNTVSDNTKAEVLYSYLCEGYNMQEVARNTLHDYNDMASQRVSNITRCYGFDGKNGGRYSKYNLTLKDIKGFVKKYPNGCFSCDTMDDYVENLDRNKQNKYDKSTKVKKSNNFDRDFESIEEYKDDKNQDFPQVEESAVFTVLIVMFILILVVCKVFLHLGWILSVIISFTGSMLFTGYLFFNGDGKNGKTD